MKELILSALFFMLVMAFYWVVHPTVEGSYQYSAGEFLHIVILGEDLDQHEPLGFRPPAYPMLLAMIYYVAGPEGDFPEAAVVMMNTFLLSLCLFISMRLARHIGVGAVRLLLPVGFLVIFGPVGEVFMIRETTFYTALLLSFILVLTFKTDLKAAVFSGLIVVLLIFTRPTGILFIPIAIAAFAFGTSSLAQFFKNSLVFLVIVFGLVFPWQVYLTKLSGTLVVASSCTSGNNAYKGQSTGDLYLYSDIDRIRLPFRNTDTVHRCVYDKDLRERANAQFWERVADKPADFVRDSVLKAILFLPGAAPLGKAEIQNNPDNSFEVHNFKFDKNRLIYFFVSFFVISLAMVGIAVTFMFRGLYDRRAPALMVSVLLVHWALYTAAWPEARFAFPFVPIYWVFVAVLVDFLSRVRLVSS